MIYGVRGRVVAREDHFAVIDLHGLGLKVAAPRRTLRGCAIGEEAALFTHLEVKEDALNLYGFTTTEELAFFEMLISVSGVGPKSAISILDTADLKSLRAAIQQERPDLLTRAVGIGRKTAERVIVELKNRMNLRGAGAVVEKMESDEDLVEVLAGLGYRRAEARSALQKLGDDKGSIEERLKKALKLLGTKAGSGV